MDELLAKFVESVVCDPLTIHIGLQKLEDYANGETDD